MSPDGFERLAQRLLREAGFVSATVAGRSGDGGIDGLGICRLSLVSFPVFYQCKRYKGSVGASKVRDFRGAMACRGDKGLLITTGSFTGDAKAEATRDGAPPIDLVDGDRLCELLKVYDLGVRTTVRKVEDVTVEPSFWRDLTTSSLDDALREAVLSSALACCRISSSSVFDGRTGTRLASCTLWPCPFSTGWTTSDCFAAVHGI
jgi:Restriction endonuclease